jgi:CRISPR-associated protein Cmr2
VLDETTLWRFIKKAYEKGKGAHKYLGIYMTQAKKISLREARKLSDGLDFRADFSELPSPRWLALKVDFELQTPWYSKDDRVFHVLDNPVRKDRVFGIPFMAASSWKGMLRWACRMRAGLGQYLQYLQEHPDMAEWSDPAWILHLFGNEKGEGEEFSRGALVFYPTWFDRIGFQVINPHSRENRAGKGPIYYEVVPPGAKGTLSLLYAPWPGMKFTADPKEVLPWLLEAIETLLTVYGISAKRTVGWGTAKIEKWQAFHNTGKNVEKESREDLWREVQAWLPGGSAP